MIKCKECEYKNDCRDALCSGYCPNLDDEDFSSALAREIEEQNCGYFMDSLSSTRNN